MVQESQEKASKLSQEVVVRERALEQQKAAAETHLIQETKLQTTISQQSKLIDFLQKPSPPSRGVRFKVHTHTHIVLDSTMHILLIGWYLCLCYLVLT